MANYSSSFADTAALENALTLAENADLITQIEGASFWDAFNDDIAELHIYGGSRSATVDLYDATSSYVGSMDVTGSFNTSGGTVKHAVFSPYGDNYTVEMDTNVAVKLSTGFFSGTVSNVIYDSPEFKFALYGSGLKLNPFGFGTAYTLNGIEVTSVIGGHTISMSMFGNMLWTGAGDGTGALSGSIFRYIVDVDGEGIDINNVNISLADLSSPTDLIDLIPSLLNGNDTLESEGFNKVLEGGSGNDTYIIKESDVSIIEEVDGGTDIVSSWADHTLNDNVENLVLRMDTLALIGTGNSLANKITGNQNDNVLTGGGGADILAAGKGNDAYVVNLVESGSGAAMIVKLEDTIVELAGQGSDTLILEGGSNNLTKATTLVLAAALEYLDTSATGSTWLNLTGNAAANTLTGNDADNILDGGAGADTLDGGLGNDTYIIDNVGDTIFEDGVGNDTVQSAAFTLDLNLERFDSIENATLTGALALNLIGDAENNILTGNSGNNRLEGNVGADTLFGGAGNDILDGGLGDDFLTGGAGNDTYYVDSINDVVSESANGGTDTLYVGLNYDLSDMGIEHVENVILTGSADVSVTGNQLGNILTGNEGVNILNGLDGKDALIGNGGDDILTGGAGVDILKGGLGNDTYNVNLTTAGKIEDVVTELSGEGTDTLVLQTNAATLALSKAITLVAGSNIDNLHANFTNETKLNLTGNTLNNELIGNDAANVLLGLVGDDTLDGRDGNDTLDGGLGADALYGGDGDDTYVVDNAADIVYEYLDEGIDLVNIAIATVGGSYTLGQYIENATLTSKVAFTLTGNELDNTLTGNAANNTLNGNDGDDILNGGAGSDTLDGGSGNDTYIIDNLGDTIVELGGDSNDTVQSANLALDLNLSKFANIENATLTGNVGQALTGNAAANILTGNAGANVIDGGSGADTMMGGGGNDTYKIDNAGDVVIEGVSAGVDSVVSSVDYTLTDNVENLTLKLGAGDLDGTGNSVANTLIGNDGNNTLTGGGGSDILKGGAGNDTYVVNLAQVGNGVAATVKFEDTVTELVNQGIDSVVLSGDFSGLAKTSTLVLGANIENFDASLTVATKLNLTGNTSNNILTGNDAANILDGGLGNDILLGGDGNDTLKGGVGSDVLHGGAGEDTLTGGAGNDLFIFGAGEATDTESDRITDFAVGDQIVLAGFSEAGGNFSHVHFDAATKLITVEGSGTDFDGTSIKLVGYTGMDISESMFSFNNVENEGAEYTALNLDTPTTGLLASHSDFDVYKVSLAGNTPLSLHLDIPGADGAPAAFAVSIANAAGDVIDSWQLTGDSTLIVPNVDAGDYFVTVTGTTAALHRAGSYTLSAETVAPTSLAVDEPATQGSLDESGDVNLFTVTLEAGKTYQFDVTGDSAATGSYTLWNPSLTLWGPDGQRVAVVDNTTYTDGAIGELCLADPHLTFTATTSGTYTIGVEAGTWTVVDNDPHYPSGESEPAVTDIGTFGIEVTESSISELTSSLLEGYRWAGSTIYYNFRTDQLDSKSTTIGNPDYGFANISEFSAAMQTKIEGWMTEWESVSGINFERNNNAEDAIHIVLGTTTSGSTGSAWRYNAAGELLFDIDFTDDDVIDSVDLTILKGKQNEDDFYHLFQHEMGHALGFSHPGAYGLESGFPRNNPAAPLGTDNDYFSVMSYNASYTELSASQQGLRILDIAAIQELYGANMSYQIGDTTWAFNDTQHEYKTAIWDAGGNDTIDASGQTLDSIIHLTAGSLSSIGMVERPSDVTPIELAAAVIPGTFGDQAYYNIGIAFGADIENAIGGSGNDYISGNALTNVLQGNAGADFLNGAEGNDTLIGGVGNDRLMGGAGDDVFRFTANGGVDTITDFVSGEDAIELYGLLSGNASDGSGGLATVAFGVGLLATTEDQRVLYDQTSGNLFLDMDGSGDSGAVLIAKLGAGTALAVSDFLLVSA